MKVDEINRGGDSLNPKMGWNVRGKKQGASDLNNMTVFLLSSVILRVSIGARELRKSPMRSEEITKIVRDVLATRVGSKDLNRTGELCPNYRSEVPIDLKKLRTSTHEVNPDITRIMINKKYIIAMATL